MLKKLFTQTKRDVTGGNGRSSPHLIDLRQIVKSYKTPAGPFLALKGVDLEVDAGEFVAVIGKSGSGKSTLINMLTGIDRPTSGEVIVGGVPIHALNEDEVALWRGQNLGVIFQFFQLLPTLTLIENIMMPMEFARLHSPDERRERALDLLEMVEMAEQADKLPSAVSGGQQQRVAIARALANDPAVLIADEPTGSLDSKTADTIFQLFEDLTAQGKTILMVTHDRDLASRVSRVVLISDGEIVDRYVSQALQTLDDKQLAQITARLEPVTYAAGTTIFEQGDRADKFYIIIRGEVEVVKQFENGTEMVTAVLDSSQYFGEIGLMNDAPRGATVRVAADKDAALVSLDRDTFATLLDGNDLTHDVMAQLMRERMTTNHILSLVPSLNAPEFAQSGTLTGHRYVEPGKTIFKKGDEAKEFFIIIEGEVEVIQPDQNDAVVARLDSGQYFGEIGLLRGGKRMATYRAAADRPAGAFLVAISRQRFVKLLDESQLSEKDLARVMVRRMR
ncbi:MAG: ATP-binding cassette domain-containing protein [Chloroflexi bacterium]|nr:MAG: ATP-binding cassette domain-containing protein [Chloroflexota bacterium]